MPVIRIDEETKAALEQHRLRLASDVQSGVGNSMNSTLRQLMADKGILEPDRKNHQRAGFSEVVEKLYLRYGSIEAVSKETGLTRARVKKYLQAEKLLSPDRSSSQAMDTKVAPPDETDQPMDRRGMLFPGAQSARYREFLGEAVFTLIRDIVQADGGSEIDLTEMLGGVYETITNGDDFITATTVGRPKSSDEVIQNLLDGLFSGALDRGIDLQLSRDRSGRWISYPDNFMSILIQPRNKALLVTVYGKPESFNELVHSLQLKADRPPYSRFHVRTKAQLAPALDIIEASRNLRAAMIFGAAAEFEPTQQFDVKPLEQTCSLLAVPTGLGKTSLLGQQIRTLRAERCLVVTSGGTAAAEATRAQLFGRFALPFKVLDSPTPKEGTNPIPDRPGKSLFVTTHDVFKNLLKNGGWERFLPMREGPLWDLVAIEDIQRVINSENFESRWEEENTLRSRTFTKHMVVLTTPHVLQRTEELDAISDLFDQRRSYAREATAPGGDLDPRMIYLPTLEEQSIRIEESTILTMDDSESDHVSKFTCTPADRRGSIEEKWFESVMAVKGLFSTLPPNTREAFTEEFRRLRAMTRKGRHSSASYEIYDERQNQLTAPSPLASGIFDEGVFIRLKEYEVSEWESRGAVIERSSQMIKSGPRMSVGVFEKVEPIMARMVLVHTFAHVLIRQWAQDCGRPVADFRERLYVDKGMAGVLIYTPGEYPTSADQPPNEVIETRTTKALANAVWCSNDPVCLETPAGFDSFNLGACHACAILPQASCEAMNCFLDRGLLVQTHHAVGAGFFPAPIHENGISGSVLDNRALD